MNYAKFGLLDYTQRGQADTLDFLNEIRVEHQRTARSHISHNFFGDLLCMTPNARVIPVLHLLTEVATSSLRWPPCATSTGTLGDNARNKRSM